jgi:threonine dehydrogenase-like Zn-dependent dehydrogenase
MLGAAHIIAIDCIPERLHLAQSQEGVTGLNYQEDNISEALKTLTGGRGPDACIDAVGLEAHGTNLDALYDRAKAAVFMTTDRIHALRQAIQACRKGGTVSIPGVYGGVPDKVPLGAAFAKGLTLKMGQTHVHKYLRPLLRHIEEGDIDPSFVITHRMRLQDAAQGYEIFKNKKDQCIKVVLQP